MNLSTRSFQKELLDGDNIPTEDLYRNLKELELINKFLGGHAVTISGFKKLLGNRKQVSVCEIGCGGGDNLVAIYEWCRKNGVQVKLIGIDMKEDCIEFAKSATYEIPFIELTCSRYETAKLSAKPDIIFSSLFCHHFSDEELVEQFTWMKQNSNVGFFVNDLHRHLFAYYSIKMLTVLFSHSYLVKNDAPLSVARGFTKNELSKICKSAGLFNCEINWEWAFRYLLLHHND